MVAAEVTVEEEVATTVEEEVAIEELGAVGAVGVVAATEAVADIKAERHTWNGKCAVPPRQGRNPALYFERERTLHGHSGKLPPEWDQ